MGPGDCCVVYALLTDCSEVASRGRTAEKNAEGLRAVRRATCVLVSNPIEMTYSFAICSSLPLIERENRDIKAIYCPSSTDRVCAIPRKVRLPDT